MVHRQACIVAIVLADALCGSSCRKSVPPAPRLKEKASLPVLELTKESRMLFTFVEPAGGFSTTDKAENVPEGARRLVRVVDPSKGPLTGQDSTQVYAVDVGQLLAAGKAQARAMSREGFETAALAQLPPGESSPMAGPHGAPLLEEPTPLGDAAADGAGGPPVVTLYGTPWCGACKAAKQYLMAKHIPFSYKDIENDPAAARELQGKAARMGIPADRVPILDVRGRLLIGFDRARLDAMLGDST